MSAVVTPDWVRDAAFYRIFPDTLARSPTLHVRDGHTVGPPLGARSGIVLHST